MAVQHRLSAEQECCARTVLYHALLMAVLASCSADVPGSAKVVHRDSAGIRIVEFASLDAEQARTLSEAPVVSLGVVEGNLAQEFDNIRSALVLSDSSIAVVNGGTNEIRFFDRHGNHTGTVGGTGDGPGEYQGLSHIGRLAGDTLFAFDRWLQRVTILTRTGTIVGTHRLPFETASRIDRLADGSFIATSFLVGMPRRPRGIHADTAEVVRYDITNARLDTLIAVTTLEWFSHGDEQPPTALPWGRTAFIVAGGEWLHVAHSDRFEVRSYDAEGRLVRIVRSVESLRPVDDQIYATMRDAWLSTNRPNPDGGVDPAMRWAELPRPDSLHELTSLQVEDDRVLWLERYESDPTRVRVWLGFDDAGPSGTLRIRAGLRVLDIAQGHVVVRRTDDLGVEYVDVHAMIRTPR